MAIPTFVQAGTGTAITGASGTVSLSGATVGNFVVVQLLSDSATDSASFSNVVNVQDITGTANAVSRNTGLAPNDGYQVGNPQSAIHEIRYGRVMANGTISVDVAPAISADLFCRWYEFSGVSTSGTLDLGVIENSDSPSDQISQIANTNTTPFPGDCVTSGADRLAVCFLALDNNQAVSAFTGSSGTWTEPVAEFASSTGTAATIQIQISPMPTATTLTGGSITITSTGWNTLTTALIPQPGTLQVPTVYPPRKFGPF